MVNLKRNLNAVMAAEKVGISRRLLLYRVKVLNERGEKVGERLGEGGPWMFNERDVEKVKEF